ncbi:hypothetical protein [Alicyclobacillus sp. SO9]|uniref:hypothetical protein n=1 Tax=Alicyclobacillus sp. SO9 TaxID=2665646 RepID=UPI0018E76020|nr:hypothetical protein [Alicyclobacillus sp. SO9]QQE79128.1 hypothetical protein GI364_01000 [Alicyclobacillus sp. SO9]
MNRVERSNFPIQGFMSLILSLAFAFVCFLMYSVMVAGFLPFTAFELTSFVFIAIPMTVGIIGLLREKTKSL